MTTIHLLTWAMLSILLLALVAPATSQGGGAGGSDDASEGEQDALLLNGCPVSNPECHDKHGTEHRVGAKSHVATAGPPLVRDGTCTRLTFEGINNLQLVHPVTAPLGISVDNGSPLGSRAGLDSDLGGILIADSFPSPSTALYPAKWDTQIQYTQTSCSTVSLWFLQQTLFTGSITFQYYDGLNNLIGTKTRTENAGPFRLRGYRGWFKETFVVPTGASDVKRIRAFVQRRTLASAVSWILDDVTCCPSECECYTASDSCNTPTASSKKVCAAAVFGRARRIFTAMITHNNAVVDAEMHVSGGDHRRCDLRWHTK